IQTATPAGELVDCEFYVAVFGKRAQVKLPAGSWPTGFEEMSLTSPPEIEYGGRHLHPQLGAFLDLPSEERVEFRVNAVGRIDFEGEQFDAWELYYNTQTR